jgi:hypothetical protein
VARPGSPQRRKLTRSFRAVDLPLPRLGYVAARGWREAVVRELAEDARVGPKPPRLGSRPGHERLQQCYHMLDRRQGVQLRLQPSRAAAERWLAKDPLDSIANVRG